MNIFSSMDLVLFFISAYVGLYHLFLFLNKKNEAEKLHFSLLCISIAVNDIACVGLYNSVSVPSGIFWQNIQFFCTVCISIEFVAFTYSLLKMKSDWPQKLFITLLSLILIGGILFNPYVLESKENMIRTVSAFGFSVTYYENKPGIIWNLLFIIQLLGMIYLYYLLIREFIIKKKKDLLPLLIGFFIFFISVLIDILISLNIILFLYTIEYSFLVLILVMDFIMLKRFVDIFDEVETLNLHLEERVEERTLETKKLADLLTNVNKSLENQNAVLKELSERDSMTDLLNHTAFHRRLLELTNLSKRQNFPIGVMLLDIDKFKSINDNYGHQAGDHVIKLVAETLYDISHDNTKISGSVQPIDKTAPLLRNYDIVGRYGGDEFIAALCCCGIDESRIITDRICKEMRELKFIQYPALHITVSIGCAVIPDISKFENELQIIKLADKALYDAKEKGRDQAVILTPDTAVK
jgi:GGDEF domain-containing protein